MTVQEIITSLTVQTDTIVEVEPTTKNHYSLNVRFEVIRENKTYYISIKEVDVMGDIKKHHTRLDVDTNLPKKEKITKKQQKIADLESKLQIAIKENHKSNIFQYKHSLKKLRGY